MNDSATEKLLVCTPRFLPRSEWDRAAMNAIKVNPANRPLDAPPGPIVTAAAGGDRLALDVKRYWGEAGVHLTVGFLDNPAADLRARILSHMNAWSQTANIQFVESDTDPQVRISRDLGGYWSYVGTDVLLIPKDRPTMNLQWFTMQTRDSEFHRVVRHEAGHTLGFPHEHMRKEIVERLDTEKVIEAYGESQGWSRDQVIAQVLTPLEESSILGTPKTDQTSIMCYQIDGSLTRDGEAIEGGLDINDLDYEFAGSVYPKP